MRVKVERTDNWVLWRWQWSVTGSGARHALSRRHALRLASEYVKRRGMSVEWEVQW